MANSPAQNTSDVDRNCELPLAVPYVPPQHFEKRYSDDDAIIRGTLFPELDLPFKNYVINNPLPDTPMTEIMKIDFVCFDLRLYLDTHPNDTKALEYYKHYRNKSKELKEKYSESVEKSGYNDWVFEPWPWE